MIDEVDLPLAERIAAIEARGAGHLRVVDRLAALRKALALTLPSSVAVPVLAFAAGWFAPLRWEVLAAATILVPVGVFSATFLRERQRHRASRQEAILLFDRTLGLKDRIAATDEFLRDGDRSAFKQAAMQEAEPWIARAAATALPQPVQAHGAWRRWPFAAAGLVLLAGTVAQQRLLPTGDSGGAIAEALGQVGIATRALPPAPARQDGSGDATTGRARTPPATSTDGRLDRVASDPRSGDAGPARDGDGASRSGSGMAQSSKGFDTPGTGQAGGTAAAPQGSARPAAAGTQSNSSRAADQSTAAQDARSPGGDRANADRAAPDKEATRPGGNTAQPNGASAAQQSSASPLTSQQRPQSSKGSNGNQPNPQNRSQENNPDQTQPGRGNAQGRNGQRNGQDGLKRSSGIAALLLAVPMADRLGGTAHPGRVSSQPRQVPPHAGAAGAVAAGDRGTGAGNAGRIPHRPATPQEKRLVRDYFRPSGARH